MDDCWARLFIRLACRVGTDHPGKDRVDTVITINIAQLSSRYAGIYKFLLDYIPSFVRVRAFVILHCLTKHPYCEHGAAFGPMVSDYPGRQYILRLFGQKKRMPKQYRKFDPKGVAMGKQPDLACDGL
jgi:hypothetical protein